MNDEKQVIAYHDFGKCPHCQGDVPLLYMISTYQLGVPSGGGKALKKVLGEDIDITAVCPECGRKYAMTTSVYGITTKDYAPLKSDQRRINHDKSINLIGFVE